MTQQSLEQISQPQDVSRATQIEQASRTAEVLARVKVAQSCQRSIPQAVAEMRESCQTMAVAQGAFFAYPQGGQTVHGNSIRLAEELARVFGNIDYGLSELRRDDEQGESEMTVWAWDMQSNSRVTRTFIVKHARDTRAGRKKITDLRDIANSNNNAASRQMRECIFKVLPRWFVEQAAETCRETLKKGDGKPLAERVSELVAAFGRGGVTVKQLETHQGREVGKWTERDVADLGVVFQSLAAKEIRRDEVFPPDVVTVDELTGEVES